MNNKEFIEYVSQLENFYNQSLNDAEREIWFKNLSFMTVERFNLIISEIFKINKYMPRLSEILEVHRQIPYTARTFEENKNIGHCEKCNDTGYVTYTKLINNMPYKYVAVCDCGRQQRYDGKQCTDPKNKSDYYIPTAREIDLKVKTDMPSNEEIIKSMKMLKDSSIISEDIKNVIRENFRKRSV